MAIDDEDVEDAFRGRKLVCQINGELGNLEKQDRFAKIRRYHYKPERE